MKQNRMKKWGLVLVSLVALGTAGLSAQNAGAEKLVEKPENKVWIGTVIDTEWSRYQLGNFIRSWTTYKDIRVPHDYRISGYESITNYYYFGTIVDYGTRYVYDIW